jgi:hypothetical protein
MAKQIALGALAFLAVFAVLVLFAGSIPPQREDQAAARRSISERTSGATAVPNSSIERITSACRAVPTDICAK